MDGGAQGSGRELLVACALRETERNVRKKGVMRALFSGCTKVNELDDGYAFEFDGGRDHLEALARFVAAERECCPFFVFEILFEPHRGPFHLRVRGPRGTKRLIRENLEEVFVRKHEVAEPE